MLIRFSVENYKSFKHRAVFSMAATKGTRHASHVYSQAGRRILKGSFLFGANASGKSNFIEAMSFARDLVLGGGSSQDTSRVHFRLEPGYRVVPGVFQFDFVVAQSQYSYGFAFSYSTMTIVSEWLAIGKQDSLVYVFNRDTTENGHIVVETDYTQLSKEDSTRFSVYSADYTSKGNIHLQQTFMLTDIAQRTAITSPFFMLFTEAFSWLRDLVFIFPSTRFLGLGEIAFDQDKRVAFEDALRYFDTGIISVTKQEVPIEKVMKTIPSNILTLAKRERGEKPIIYNDGKRILHLENHKDGQLVVHQMLLNHGMDSDLFESTDESDGTLRLFDFIPLLLENKPRVIIIDEIDRSLHSKVLEAFIASFYLKTEDKPIQLIATTHDSNILNLEALRQDEIWFVERQSDCSSRLFSLSEFKERFDKNIEKEYLLGRYGAIPIFSAWEDGIDTE